MLEFFVRFWHHGLEHIQNGETAVYRYFWNLQLQNFYFASSVMDDSSGLEKPQNPVCSRVIWRTWISYFMSVHKTGRQFFVFFFSQLFRIFCLIEISWLIWFYDGPEQTFLICWSFSWNRDLISSTRMEFWWFKMRLLTIMNVYADKGTSQHLV